MISDSSLREYYINMNRMYENCVNILSALNLSLYSASSEVSVNIKDSLDNQTTLRIPSFLYLENKLEQLDMNFDTLFQIPSSGEAWFSSNENMFKLQLVKSNNAPQSPSIVNVSKLVASITDNNILKDMVSPKTYLKVDIGNLSNNIELIFMKKLVIYKESVFNGLKNLNLNNYGDYESVLYNYSKGIDYDEYDSTITLPIKKQKYKSAFSIIEIPNDSNYRNPWLNEKTGKYSYEIVLDTLEYYDSDNQELSYTLKRGDLINIKNSITTYQVKQVSLATNTIEIEEYIGHSTLATIQHNSTMVFEIYNTDYDDYHYVQVPLEENQYICVFLGTIYQGVRSDLSQPMLIDLGLIYMLDKGGNFMYKSNGDKMTYMEYYKTYCTNIGDLILGLTQSAYPLISNFTTSTLNDILESEAIKQAVNDSCNNENILQVVPINKHLVDDVTNESIINLHNQKNDLNSQLTTIQANIDLVYNTLITTDFSLTTSVTLMNLQAQLTNYYTERNEITKQVISVVESINTKSENSSIKDKTKYRVRGVTKVDTIQSFLKTIDNNIEIIGLDVEYKYKSVTKDTTNVAVIDLNTFTDWNRLDNIDRQRKLVLDTSLNTIKLEFEDYNTNDNKIKWNLIDIPIQQGEDVVIRIRYKYNIGQPFVNLYTPWSDEIVMIFPNQYTEDLEVVDIINQNREDAISARFNSTLINDGYSEHINNKLITGDLKFFHLPDNIYSGFNTLENNLISLKDKLYSMVKSIDNLDEMVGNVTNSRFQVYLSYDDKQVELFANQLNHIQITDNENISTNFVKKKMNIVIRNTGSVPVRLYSIFPGNINYSLLMTDNDYYNELIGNYQSVPLFSSDTLDYQRLGLWIYFRSTNPYTRKSVYTLNKTMGWSMRPDKYMTLDYSQPAYIYRNRTANDIDNAKYNYWNALYYNYNKFSTYDENNKASILSYTVQDTIMEINWDEMTIEEATYQGARALFVNRYEDIYFIKKNSNSLNKTFLDEKSDLGDFVALYKENYVSNGGVSSIFRDIVNYNGAFLYPDLNNITDILTNGDTYDCKVLEVGESVSVPITFEYYIDRDDIDSITKALYFDLRNSLMLDYKHFMLEITAVHNTNYTTYNQNIIQDVLYDEATNG